MQTRREHTRITIIILIQRNSCVMIALLSLLVKIQSYKSSVFESFHRQGTSSHIEKITLIYAMKTYYHSKGALSIFEFNQRYIYLGDGINHYQILKAVFPPFVLLPDLTFFLL